MEGGYGILVIWKWKAVDKNGIIRTGLRQDKTMEYVVAGLRGQNLYPLAIRPYALGMLRQRLLARSPAFWVRTVRKMQTLLQSGLPLLTVLEILNSKESNILIKTQWDKVHYDMTAGQDFSASLSGFVPEPGAFLSAMITAGENSGSLAECLSDAAEQLEQEYRFRQKITTALFYPALLLAGAVIVVYTLSRVILPVYADLFDGLGAELPFLTRLLFKGSGYIPYAVVIMATLIILYRLKPKKSSAGRIFFPGTRQIFRYRELMLFTGLFEKLLKTGYSVADTVKILEKTPISPELGQLVQDLKFAVNEGRRISPVFFLRPCFPLEAAKMLAIAEESGQVGEMFGHLVHMFKTELQERLERYSRTIEPVLVMGMAGLVGIVAVGVLMPVFEMSTHIR